MATVTCLRHFETDIDPKTPPTEWDLSKDGAAAEAAFLEEDWLDSLDAVYTSPERKAERTATAVAERVDAPLHVEERLREVDRSDSGFVDQSEYEALARDYCRVPEVDTPWEHRLDVEKRIHRFVADFAADGAGNALVVSHGLLLTTMLAPVLDRARFALWEEMGYGETSRVEMSDLEREWVVHAPGR